MPGSPHRAVQVAMVELMTIISLVLLASCFPHSLREQPPFSHPADRYLANGTGEKQRSGTLEMLGRAVGAASPDPRF
ncbi:hypothetical protein C8Q69DRAFT_70249 [Paecilomyces variotii]|uniref:Uncharacterized protein n=1 Tax=Byssochlamys spectabilis TaxID=264951 RepID=A0A443HNN4_BYSSP|nr:hypothetical protein C8Q69DRAFT_70249 [Paecilomyces variotii]RWQ93433.1 hypothetical protein C8Q69DRAFT_70249 [Paecilomyces variotii]